MPSMTLKQIVEQFNLEVLAGKSGLGNELTEIDIKRPGIELAGYWEYFTPERVQLLGKTEITFLREMAVDVRRATLEKFFSFPLPGVIVTSNLTPPKPMVEMAEEAGIPLCRVDTSTTSFLALLSHFLEVELAPMEVVHGVLVEVYGIGILLTGESGVGKSEVALELVKRGHRLISDDLVELRLIGAKDLIGRASILNRQYMEVRGLGIIDIKTLFGAGAIKLEQPVQLVIQLREWQHATEDTSCRLGLHNLQVNLLGTLLPKIVIPVRPGRHLATVIEVAAMNHRLKYMGYNAAEEFIQRMDAEIARKKEQNPQKIRKVSKDGSATMDHSFNHSRDEWSNDGKRG